MPGLSISQKMAENLREVSDLRYSIEIPPNGSDSSILLASLQDHRARLDRIEHLLVSCVIHKAKAAIAVRSANDELSDKWDTNISDQKKQKSVNLVVGNQFEAPKEKYATANLATFEQRRVVRTAEEELIWIETAIDAIQKMYRGLDASRQDILTRIRAVPVVSSLEYTTS